MGQQPKETRCCLEKEKAKTAASLQDHNRKDLVEIVAELENHFLFGETADFNLNPKSPGASIESLNKVLCRQIAFRAELLQSNDRAVKELIIQQGNLVATYQNIKLQYWLWAFTALMVILTVLIAVLTMYLAKPNWLP
ncbi:MAG: hypothetical protein WDN72_09055 [Alphaproteobacteria bacterium]